MNKSLCVRVKVCECVCVCVRERESERERERLTAWMCKSLCVRGALTVNDVDVLGVPLRPRRARPAARQRRVVKGVPAARQRAPDVRLQQRNRSATNEEGAACPGFTAKGYLVCVFVCVCGCRCGCVSYLEWKLWCKCERAQGQWRPKLHECPSRRVSQISKQGHCALCTGQNLPLTSQASD